PEETSYEINLTEGTTELPLVSAMASNDGATVMISQACEPDNTAFVKVISQTGLVMMVYSLVFRFRDPVDAEELPAGPSLRIYPNPNQGRFYITWNKSMGTSSARVTVTSLTGTLLHSEEFFAPAGNSEIEIDLGETLTGIYLVQISSDDSILLRKISILR
ncbi:MAG: T9SS type A sorting domain-containing protein, partial [Bacteroidales bacterium]|nr:T9SS type A sorting domain-containing protein [Bacteroidales bacterium]